MATIIYDEIEGSRLEAGPVSRRIRRARIKNLTVAGTTSVPDAWVLEKALTYLPAIGSPYPAPSGGWSGSGATEILGLVLRRHVIVPRMNNQVMVDLIYETPDVARHGTPAASYLLTDASRLVGERTNMLPGTRLALKLKWGDPGDPNNFVPEDYLTIDYEKSFRVLRMAQILYSTPPAGPREAMGTVNDATWYGYPAGYWRVDAYETTTRDRGNSYYVNAELASRVDEDWSTYGILQNRVTGRYVKVDQDAINILVADPYIYGITTVQIDDKDTGVAKVGPHRMTNFSSLFGDP